MGDDKKKAVNIKDIDFDLWLAVKVEAGKRGISANDLYLKMLSSGAKRLKVLI